MTEDTAADTGAETGADTEIEVHIAELVLHGVAPELRHRIADQLVAALTEHAAHAIGPAARPDGQDVQLGHLRAAPIELAGPITARNADGAGAAIGRSITRSITRSIAHAVGNGSPRTPGGSR